MKTPRLLLVALFAIFRTETSASHVLHGLFFDSVDDSNVYYGSFDVDASQLTIINPLSIDQIGNPKERKYAALPMTYDPTHDLVFIAASNPQKQVILSVINATSGALLNAFTSTFVNIVSLQYDIFQQQLFAHVETKIVNQTDIIEIHTNNGTIKRVLATIHDAQPTDISSYCPVCRKYFLMVLQNNRFVYVGVDSTDAGGISWQSPMDFTPVSIKFDYKTFILYAAYINQTQSMIGIVNRTSGGISKVVATISHDSNLLVTGLSAFAIAEKMYYTSTIFRSPYSLGVSYVNVNTSQTTVDPLTAIPYAWLVKEFVH